MCWVQIVLHHRAPAVVADAVQRRRELAARAIEQAVDGAVPRQRIGNRAAHAGLVADVAGVQADAAAGLGVDPADFVLRRLQLVELAPYQRQARAQRRQLVRGAAAQPAAAPGHDDGLALIQPRPEYRRVALAGGDAACFLAHVSLHYFF
jgi:hypothetical protein